MNYLTIPGHVPVKQAALLIGVSQERVLQHIRTKHLPSCCVEGRYLIPQDALANFVRKPHGRTRTNPVHWKRYRAGASVYLLSIEVQAFPNRLKEFYAKLIDLEKTQQHCFPGTMQRTISANEDDPAHITILLIWKDTELPKEARLQHDLEDFKSDFAGVVDWSTAHYSRKKAQAYT